MWLFQHFWDTVYNYLFFKLKINIISTEQFWNTLIKTKIAVTLLEQNFLNLYIQKNKKWLNDELQ